MNKDTGLFYDISYRTPEGSGYTQAPVGFEFDPTGKPWLWALLPGGITVEIGRDAKTLRNALQALEQVESSGWHHPTRGGFLAGGPLRPNGADLRQALRAAI